MDKSSQRNKETNEQRVQSFVSEHEKVELKITTIIRRQELSSSFVFGERESEGKLEGKLKYFLAKNRDDDREGRENE